MPCFLAQRVLFVGARWDKSSLRTSGVFGLLCGRLGFSLLGLFVKPQMFKNVKKEKNAVARMEYTSVSNQ